MHVILIRWVQSIVCWTTTIHEQSYGDIFDGDPRQIALYSWRHWTYNQVSVYTHPACSLPITLFNWFCREILELAISIKHQRPIGADTLSLTKLLIAKEKELKETFKVADEQAKVQEQMDRLQNEVDRQDQFIKQFERQIKDAQQTLVSWCFLNCYSYFHYERIFD